MPGGMLSTGNKSSKTSTKVSHTLGAKIKITA